MTTSGIFALLKKHSLPYELDKQIGLFSENETVYKVLSGNMILVWRDRGDDNASIVTVKDASHKHEPNEEFCEYSFSPTSIEALESTIRWNADWQKYRKYP